MKNRLLPETGKHLKLRRWIWITVIVVATVASLAGRSAWATDAQVDFRQTVPPPPTREPEPQLPAPTPRPDRDNRDDNDNNGGTQAVQPAVAGAPAGAAAVDAGLTAAQTTGELTGVVAAVTLNMREGPGTTFPVVGKLSQGDSVIVRGRNEGGDWWSVCCVPGSETSGWVSNAFVTPNFGADEVAALPILGTENGAQTPGATATAVSLPAGEPLGSINAVTLNVRSGASTENDVAGKLRQGDVVRLLEQNEAGDWWYVCCIPGTETSGWVSAEFITLDSAPEAAAAVPVAAEAVAATVTPEPAVMPGATAEPTSAPSGLVASESAQSTGTTTLALLISAQPPAAIQGKTITLVFDIGNTGSADATNVDLRNVLPAELSLIRITAADGGVVTQEEGDDGTTLLNVLWPALPASGAASATALVGIAADLADGTVFDDLASVTADNAEEVGAGISIGLPPALLPEFW